MEANTGKVVQVMGPVVDIEFSPGRLPSIYSALTLTNPFINDKAQNLVVEVAQHLGENTVRCISMDTTDGLVRGMTVTDTVVREQPKVGRNEPCPCGSGKKFKQCHGK